MSANLDSRNTSEHAQALFKELFLASPDAIVLTDAEGRITATNPVVEKLFGYSETELIGNAVELLMPERLRRRHPDHRLAFLGAPSVRPMGTGLELFGQRKDGTEFPIDIMLSPVETDGNRSILAVVRDITDRKRAEIALRRSEERFRLLVEGAQDYAIFMIDPEGRVATWNSGAERIKGYRADEILGRHFSTFYPQESIERGKPEHELEVAAAEGRFEDEGWRIRKDGSRFWANVIITALRGKNGELIGFSKVTRDFTNRKSAEESLALELSRTVLANPDITQTLLAIELSIQRLIPHDCAVFQEGTQPIQGTPEGWVFVHQEPLLMTQTESKGAGPATWQVQAGIQSGCWVPLQDRGEVVGTLFVGTRTKQVFDGSHIDTLTIMARQIDHKDRIVLCSLHQ
jgi:formate hydrogenlyase transcriptional activator